MRHTEEMVHGGEQHAWVAKEGKGGGRVWTGKEKREDGGGGEKEREKNEG